MKAVSYTHLRFKLSGRLKGFYDLLQSGLFDPFDCQKLLWFLFHNFYCSCTETSNNGLCHLFSDSFHEAGCEIGNDAISAGWNSLLEMLHLELKAIIGLLPLTLNIYVYKVCFRKEMTHSGKAVSYTHLDVYKRQL